MFIVLLCFFKDFLSFHINFLEKIYQIPKHHEPRKDYIKSLNAKSLVSSTDSSDIFEEMPILNDEKLHKVRYSATQSKKKHSYVTKKSTLNRSTGNNNEVQKHKY